MQVPNRIKHAMCRLFGEHFVLVFSTKFCLAKGKGGKGALQQNSLGSPANAGAKKGLEWIHDNF